MYTTKNIKKSLIFSIVILIMLFASFSVVYPEKAYALGGWGGSEDTDFGWGCCDGGDSGWSGDDWGDDFGGGAAYGAGSDPTPNPPTPPAPTCSISATPNPVNYDGTVTLKWTTTNATGASINGIGYVQVGANKTMTVPHLKSNTTYTMTVTGAGGTSTCKVTVTVKPRPSCTIKATPSTIEKGGNVTLVWTSSNANTASISGIGTVGLNGSYTVSNIRSNKTYTMTVSKDGVSETCSVKITVKDEPAPSCELTVSPRIIDEGDDVRLSWTSNNAVKARISDGIGEVSLDGSKKIYDVTRSNTYVMTVENSEGKTSTCRARVKVREQDLTCNIYANPNPNNTGSTTLVWDSDGASWAMINNGVGSVSTSGRKTISGLENGTKVYTLTVGTSHSGGKTKTCSVTVRTNKTTVPTPTPSPAPSCSLTASRSYIIKGEGSTLYWTSQNAVSVIFEDNGAVASSGSRVVYPTQSGYYRIMVTNADGTQNTCDTYITVENPVTVVSVSSIPYTGPNDGIYFALLSIIFAGSVFGIYRRRQDIMELIRI